MEYSKPWLSLDEQAELLIDRGVTGERAVIVERLKSVGYYRLTGYLHVFKMRDGRYRPGTTIDRAWDLYVFDRQLRLIVLDAVERVEVYMRSRLAYFLAEETGPFGYLRRSGLPRFSYSDYLSFQKRCMDCFSRSREPFADHFREVYGDTCGMPPYWIMVNTMELGLLLKLYKGAPVSVRQSVASELGVSTVVLESWMIALNTVRNICAHHGRLWNRPFGTKPKIPNQQSDARWHEPFKVKGDRIFGILTILNYLLGIIAPQSAWPKRLGELISTRSMGDMLSMGFSDGWRECPFWSREGGAARL